MKTSALGVSSKLSPFTLISSPCQFHPTKLGCYEQLELLRCKFNRLCTHRKSQRGVGLIHNVCQRSRVSLVKAMRVELETHRAISSPPSTPAPPSQTLSHLSSVSRLSSGSRLSLSLSSLRNLCTSLRLLYWVHPTNPHSGDNREGSPLVFSLLEQETGGK